MAKRTTVYLDENHYRRIADLANAEGRTAAELIRAAIAEYLRRRAPRSTAVSIGAGRSGRGDLAERAEELLDGFGAS